MFRFKMVSLELLRGEFVLGRTVSVRWSGCLRCSGLSAGSLADSSLPYLGSDLGAYACCNGESEYLFWCVCLCACVFVCVFVCACVQACVRRGVCGEFCCFFVRSI